MSMHLEGPWLSTTGKRKGKVKFRSSEEAKRARELEDSWKELQKKWGVEQEERKKKHALSSKPLKQESTIYRRTTVRPPSVESNHVGAVSSKASPVYTGTKIIGIGTMHKSNAVPIFSDDEAKDISSMRR